MDSFRYPKLNAFCAMFARPLTSQFLGETEAAWETALAKGFSEDELIGAMRLNLETHRNDPVKEPAPYIWPHAWLKATNGASRWVAHLRLKDELAKSDVKPVKSEIVWDDEVVVMPDGSKAAVVAPARFDYRGLTIDHRPIWDMYVVVDLDGREFALEGTRNMSRMGCGPTKSQIISAVDALIEQEGLRTREAKPVHEDVARGILRAQRKLSEQDPALAATLAYMDVSIVKGRLEVDLDQSPAVIRKMAVSEAESIRHALGSAFGTRYVKLAWAGDELHMGEADGIESEEGVIDMPDAGDFAANESARTMGVLGRIMREALREFRRMEALHGKLAGGLADASKDASRIAVAFSFATPEDRDRFVGTAVDCGVDATGRGDNLKRNDMYVAVCTFPEGEEGSRQLSNLMGEVDRMRAEGVRVEVSEPLHEKDVPAAEEAVGQSPRTGPELAAMTQVVEAEKAALAPEVSLAHELSDIAEPVR